MIIWLHILILFPIAFSYEELLDNPSALLSRLSSLLDCNINPMISSIISDIILTRKKEERQAPEIYMLLCTLLGTINNNTDRLSRSEIDYAQCMDEILSVQAVLNNIDCNLN